MNTRAGNFRGRFAFVFVFAFPNFPVIITSKCSERADKSQCPMLLLHI